MSAGARSCGRIPARMRAHVRAGGGRVDGPAERSGQREYADLENGRQDAGEGHVGNELGAAISPLKHAKVVEQDAADEKLRRRGESEVVRQKAVDLGVRARPRWTDCSVNERFRCGRGPAGVSDLPVLKDARQIQRDQRPPVQRRAGERADADEPQQRLGDGRFCCEAGRVDGRVRSSPPPALLRSRRAARVRTARAVGDRHGCVPKPDIVRELRGHACFRVGSRPGPAAGMAATAHL